MDEAILGGPDAGSGGDPEADAERLAVLLAQGAHALLAPAAPQATAPDLPGEGAEGAGIKDTAFQQEDIDTILQGRTEKRQLGSRAGNTFSVARFAAVEEEEPVAVPKGREYWAELLPEAVAAHDEREMAKMRGPLVDGPRQRKQVDYRINGRAQRTTQESSSDSEGGTRRKGGGAAKKGAKRAGSHDDDYQADADEAQPGDGEAGLPKNPKKVAGGGSSWIRAGMAALGCGTGRKSGAAAEGSPPPKKWTARELKVLEEGLIALGSHRWADLQLLSDPALHGRTLEEVKAAGTALAQLIEAAPAVCSAALEASAAATATTLSKLMESLAASNTGGREVEKAVKRERTECEDKEREAALKACPAFAQLPPYLAEAAGKTQFLKMLGRAAATAAQSMQDANRLQRLVSEAEAAELAAMAAHLTSSSSQAGQAAANDEPQQQGVVVVVKGEGVQEQKGVDQSAEAPPQGPLATITAGGEEQGQAEQPLAPPLAAGSTAAAGGKDGLGLRSFQLATLSPPSEVAAAPGPYQRCADLLFKAMNAGKLSSRQAVQEAGALL
ncbi:hypothetical protein QJQ45_016934, partial [Haematococcus lacustris]